MFVCIWCGIWLYVMVMLGSRNGVRLVSGFDVLLVIAWRCARTGKVK